jgi:hypothetical protein
VSKEISSDEIVVEILRVMSDGESKRNKLFERAIKIFCTMIVLIIIAFGLSLTFILNSLFV